MVNFGPLIGWYLSGSLGHPCKFQWVSRLGSVTAWHCSSGCQPNFAALHRGHHLYSIGRPSRWALAHITSCCLMLLKCIWHFFCSTNMMALMIVMKASSDFVSLISGDWKPEAARWTGRVWEQAGWSARRDRRHGESDRPSSLHEPSRAASRHHR